ncbi:hypothetical protein GGR52DRAFT_448378 [Hypoxylon sp. FL1284]|nr:hypothetical protein GGR52DRAFT_448378 [Hypoxylon sp. FL1284]
MEPLSQEELAKDQSPVLLPIFVVFTILPMIAVTLRIVARRVTHQKIGCDDWLVIVAVSLCIVQFAFLIEALRYGLGKHSQAVPKTSLAPYLLYTYLSELYYATDVTLIKLSILTLYLRLFNVDKRFRVSCYVMMVFVLAWGIAIVFTTIFQGSPVPAAWDKTIPDSKCFHLSAFLVGSNVPNILADVVIITLPMPLLWGMKLSPIRKLGLIALFLVAAIATVISIIRCYTNASVDPADATWNFVIVAILSTVEVNVGVCCACMPVIHPLFRLVVGRRVGSTNRSGSDDARYVRDKHSTRIRRKLAGGSGGDTGLGPSDTDQLWSVTSCNAGGEPGDDRGGTPPADPQQPGIPMNRILVTRDLDVWPLPNEPPPST